jgi:Mg-chelatase subunit ChlD
MVDAAMGKIIAAHNAGSPLLSLGGTDVAAQFSNAADFIRQTGDGQAYRVVILTDGWSTTPPATSIRLPATAIVVIAGVGQFDASIKTPSEEQIAAAKQRLDDICGQTGATCIPAMTDYTTTTK